MNQTLEKAHDGGEKAPPLSCEDCEHFTVCTIIKAMAEFIAKTYPDGPSPIDPMDLHKICKEGPLFKVQQIDLVEEALLEP